MDEISQEKLLETYEKFMKIRESMSNTPFLHPNKFLFESNCISLSTIIVLYFFIIQRMKIEFIWN